MLIEYSRLFDEWVTVLVIGDFSVDLTLFLESLAVKAPSVYSVLATTSRQRNLNTSSVRMEVGEQYQIGSVIQAKGDRAINSPSFFPPYPSHIHLSCYGCYSSLPNSPPPPPLLNPIPQPPTFHFSPSSKPKNPTKTIFLHIPFCYLPHFRKNLRGETFKPKLRRLETKPPTGHSLHSNECTRQKKRRRTWLVSPLPRTSRGLGGGVADTVNFVELPVYASPCSSFFPTILRSNRIISSLIMATSFFISLVWLDRLNLVPPITEICTVRGCFEN